MDNEEYIRTLKPGDKALLDAPLEEAEKWCEDARKLNGTIITIREQADMGGWWICELDTWFEYRRFKPVTQERQAPVNTTMYCNCNSPDLVMNTANGNEFQFCRICKKEKM